jgi:hypothetical protein
MTALHLRRVGDRIELDKPMNKLHERVELFALTHYTDRGAVISSRDEAGEWELLRPLEADEVLMFREMEYAWNDLRDAQRAVHEITAKEGRLHLHHRDLVKQKSQSLERIEKLRGYFESVHHEFWTEIRFEFSRFEHLAVQTSDENVPYLKGRVLDRRAAVFTGRQVHETDEKERPNQFLGES